MAETDPDSDLAPAVEETARAIAEMEIRGAAAIADAAAAALGAQAEESDAGDPAALRAELRAASRRLLETRPTAVSLPNALRWVLSDLRADSVAGLQESVLTSVEAFRRDLDRAQDRLGRVGANRLRDGDVVMTHCHSTDALACVEAALADGKSLSAVVTETRPRNQGRITARQLREWDVPVTFIVDGAARRYLNDVDHVLVGADTIAADGAVINKIGTSGLAVNARDRGTPVMVAAQTIKLDPATLAGHVVEIEERDAAEVLPPDDREGLEDVTVANPAFDVTPPRFVDAIVTERGQFAPEAIAWLIRDLFGTGIEEPWEEDAG